MCKTAILGLGRSPLEGLHLLTNNSNDVGRGDLGVGCDRKGAARGIPGGLVRASLLGVGTVRADVDWDAEKADRPASADCLAVLTVELVLDVATEGDGEAELVDQHQLRRAHQNLGRLGRVGLEVRVVAARVADVPVFAVSVRLYSQYLIPGNITMRVRTKHRGRR